MKFFNRSQLLFKILCAIDALIGVFLLINLIGFDFKDVSMNPENYIFLYFAVGFFLILTIINIILKCIISDASEDFKVTLNYCAKDSEQT